MLLYAFLPLLASLGHALPQEDCSTTTKQVIVPTRTATYRSTAVITERPSTARNLGTFTLWTTISSTKTLQTLTSTETACGETGVVTIPASVVTVYGSDDVVERSVPSSSPALAKEKRAFALNRRACVVTETSYTTYGQTYTYIPASRTSTFYDYTAFTQATVTSTRSGVTGTAYAIATMHETSAAVCGPTTSTSIASTSTVSMDPKCSPAAMTSAYNGYGIEWLSDTPATGATYKTNTTDASTCCQLCATSWQCAASAWDMRTGECRLEFPTDPLTTEMNCGQGVLAYYDAGPATPMSPGTGWYVAQLCGTANFGASQPDDGS
ncbi:hypothetical protein AC579_565 [Pseudocercospora musae]|uniref:Apple domain-containing protein n=1 Tax=Pseudocercospora musae TaxID=113226 RepID=A0A139H551_9PEZI|nr:hypothetical protein AC579_565 [Pseudocercospora musae]